ncbi:hypothetical protein HQ533_00435 [Candidatus Woesearchaeota archaeon]|nr:hypothetical protein [Candidatus Woesearchaeota archaeon]
MPVKKRRKTTKRKVSKKTKQPTLSTNGKIGLAIIVIAIIAGLIFAPKGAPPSQERVVLDMYVMSQCPYGVQAEAEAIKAVEKFGDDIDLNIYFIVSPTGEDSFQSLHGQPEVDENMRQACIQELYPELYQDYLLCFAPNYRNAESQYSVCANQLGIDIGSVSTCFAERGVELLKTSAAKTSEVGARASPTIFLNGDAYSSGRSELDFVRAFCDIFDYEHEACAEISKPVALKVTILTDDDCPACGTSNTVGVTKQLFPGAEFEVVDVDTEEGQELVETHQLVYLPAYIFEQALLETNSWKTNNQIRGAFVESGDSFRLRDEATGANWYIDEEKRAAFLAEQRKLEEEMQAKLETYSQDNLNVLGYTETDTKPRLDYFVMSFCPYGNPADEAVSYVYELLGDKITIVPHHILSVSGDKVASLHGEQEGNQGVRELCVLDNNGFDNFFKFTLKANELCDSRNADTCWESAAEAAGLDLETIRTCEQERKLEIAAEQNSIMMSLLSERRMQDGSVQLVPPQASPTFLINGKTYLGSRDSEGIKNALCLEFTDAPEECGEIIVQETSAPQGNC